jgi:hypothetical protein
MLAMVCLLGAIRAETGPLPLLEVDPDAFTIDLTTEHAEYDLGEVPAVQVNIHNNLKRDVLIVGNLDGSSLGRPPLCTLTVTRPDGLPPPPLDGFCGFQNPLRPEDFVSLKAGDTIDPYMKVDDYGFWRSWQLREEVFDIPGTYTLQVTYATDVSTRFEDWQGSGSRAMADHMQKFRTFYDGLAKVPGGSFVRERIQAALAAGERRQFLKLFAQVPVTHLVSEPITVTIKAPAN